MGFGIARRYKRWRHGRGFGIHSPFAFDFITHTLRERRPYYAYDNIDAIAAETRDSDLPWKRLRLIFRIAVRYNPATVGIFGNLNIETEKKVIENLRSDVSIRTSPEDCDFAIINSDCDGLPSVKPQAVYIFPDARRSNLNLELWSQVKRGMRFDNCKDFVVIVTSPSVSRQSFEVAF